MEHGNLRDLSDDELRRLALRTRDRARRLQSQGDKDLALFWIDESNIYRREIARRAAATTPTPTQET